MTKPTAPASCGQPELLRAVHGAAVALRLSDPHQHDLPANARSQCRDLLGRAVPRIDQLRGDLPGPDMTEREDGHVAAAQRRRRFDGHGGRSSLPPDQRERLEPHIVQAVLAEHAVGILLRAVARRLAGHPSADPVQQNIRVTGDVLGIRRTRHEASRGRRRLVRRDRGGSRLDGGRRRRGRARRQQQTGQDRGDERSTGGGHTCSMGSVSTRRRVESASEVRSSLR
jgi:hypothetical protein